MSMLFSSPKAPQAPPPPPAAPQTASPSIMEQAASERETLASAEGGGMNGTDVTGGKGAAAPSTTKSLLGG